MSNTKKAKKSVFDGVLNGIERIGNKLPHPITLFFILAVFVVALSALLSAMGVSATGDLVSNGKMQETTVTAQSLLTREGIVFMLTKAVDNFTGYAPLGMVLVAMLGVGVAETSGFIAAATKRIVAVTPRSLITPVLVFLGVMSNIASDVGYIVLVPLGAIIFLSYGRHPLAGIAAAFAGVSGGFSANLLIGTLDPLMAGISNEAVKLVDPNYVVEPTGNMYFMMVSVLLITILGTIITEKVVEPRLGAYKGSLAHGSKEEQDISDVEKKALKKAALTLLAMVVIIVALCIPSNSIFRGDNGSLLGKSPLIQGVIIIVCIFFFVPSVVYGFASGKYKNDKDVCSALAQSMSHMSSYIALSFVAAQFINYFNYSKLGTILALHGAAFFKAIDIGTIPLMILFVLFSAFLNLFMGSASAKWAILAPVFVPMFMLLNYSPEMAQVAFRIGDSCTNIITPMMSFFAMIVVFVQEYDDEAGMGTLTSMMLPYTIVFLIGWTLMMIVWIPLGLPLGPNSTIFLAA
mgnify:CR=1 FL=1